jgi:crotonobetainyl-CoA:carnitine CoA-transferase CaiB-like acyl-CoA transferase
VVQALEGIRILDLSWGIAGPLGVLLLAEQGADVIKVEPPGGDPFRSYPGSRCWNRSRRSVVADLKTPDGLERFRELAASADAVVETFRPGVADRLGIGYESLAEINRGLVMLSCPGYPAGHRLAGRPGFDALVQASSGQMWEQPGWRLGPVFLHMPMPSMGACYLVAAGVLAGLAARQRTGRGQHVQTSLYQGTLLYTTLMWQDVERADAAYHELTGKTYPPGVHQQMLFECARGHWIHVSVMSGMAPLKSMDEVVGLDGPDPLTAMTLKAAERAALEERRRAVFLRWDADDLAAELQANNHAAEVVTPAYRILTHPQTVANETVAVVVDPDVGATTQMGVPIHLLATPGRIRGPQPRVGEHSDEVFATVKARPPSAPASRPAGVGGALAGVRVLDFGQYLAGPFGPMVLGDLGAEVIKIEPPGGDNMRMSGKPFVGCQRGKRSLALDLKHPAGLDVAKRLVTGADVVHHNMTRGVAGRLGIDYAACRALRDDIIYCNTYAYGLADPLGRSGGLDPLYQASAGLEYEAGAVATGNAPLYLRFGMCDTSNAMLSVVGVLLALVHRQRTGEGQELWTSLHDGGLLFSSDVWTGPGGEPWDRPGLDKGLNGTDALYRLYRTQDEGWICIAAFGDDRWRALCRVLGVGSLVDDARFVTPDARRRHRSDLEASLGVAFATRTYRYWTRALDDAGVPNEVPVDTFDGRSVFSDADNVRLGLVTTYEHPVLGRLSQFGHLITFSETESGIAGPPPLVGQHGRAILHEAGYRDADVDALVAGGIVYEPDDHYRDRFQN